MNNHCFKAGENARKNGKKGGIASGKARRKKQKTQQILSDLLTIKNKDFATFQKSALELGLDGDISIHELFTFACLLNTLEKGNLSDLGQLQKLLGEQTEIASTEAQKQAAFLDAVKKAVTNTEVVDPLTLSLMEEAERMEREWERGSHEESNAPDFEVSCTGDS